MFINTVKLLAFNLISWHTFKTVAWIFFSISKGTKYTDKHSASSFLTAQKFMIIK